MPHNPKQSDDLSRLLRRATQPPRPSTLELESTGTSDDADDEKLMLLAMGDGDRLDADDRERLLDRITRDPAAAELVAQLHALDLATPKLAARNHDRVSRFVRLAWAVAACLTVALGLWRWIAPPAASRPVQTAVSPADPAFKTLGQPNDGAAHEYWDQLDVQHRREQHDGEHDRNFEHALSDRLRDCALVACALACMLLSIPVVWWAIRGSRVVERVNYAPPPTVPTDRRDPSR